MIKYFIVLFVILFIELHSQPILIKRELRIFAIIEWKHLPQNKINLIDVKFKNLSAFHNNNNFIWSGFNYN